MAAASEIAATQHKEMLRGWEEVIMAKTKRSGGGYDQVYELRTRALFSEHHALYPTWCTEAALPELNHYRALYGLTEVTLSTDDKGALPSGRLTKPAREVKKEEEKEEEEE